MEELNNYIYSVFLLIKQVHENGQIKRPYNRKINRNDRMIIRKIYDLYKIYQYGLTRKDFNKISIDYSINKNMNIISSAKEMAETLEKTINK